jgi:hypothetical protein
MELRSLYDLRDEVYIDSDKSIKGYVTGFNWKGSEILVEVGWIHNGASYSVWMAEWRLSKARG